MINRISEIPFWGPEEQIRRFINQHDEMSELYNDALRRLDSTINVDNFPTEAEKKAKLKELIVSLVGEIDISSNKFIIDNIQYAIGDTQITWGDSQTAPIYKSFILEHKGTAVNGEQVVIKQEYWIVGEQVKWINGNGDQISVDIIDSKFTIDKVEYEISDGQVSWTETESESEGEESKITKSTSIYDTFMLEDNIEYIKYLNDNDEYVVKLSLSGENTYFNKNVGTYLFTQKTITQQRIESLDEIYQKQLIWSYGLKNVDDAYFYQDWCPIGDYTSSTGDPKWQMDLWGEAAENIKRSMDRSFDFRTFVGYQKSALRGDELPTQYDASSDIHTKESDIESGTENTDLDIDTLRHNIMRSYFEVSEWLGDGAIAYGSQNGYVSRKMSLAWLFNAIKALINWKLANQDKWSEVDIHPLVTDQYELKNRPAGGWEPNVTYYRWDSTSNSYIVVENPDDYPSLYVLASGVHERFLKENEPSSQGYTKYDDAISLDQMSGCCATQPLARAKEPWKNGVLKVRGNEFHYGERSWFWTHTSFIGECRFFHNARFLGQTTFDKEINGTSLRSRWADLAEYKQSDRQYEPGTLVMFGGEKEITVSDGKICNAIVTTKPGLVLNSEGKSGEIMVGIALCGTVPVSVAEPVRKFDKLVASYDVPGKARRRRWYDFFKKTIGIALEDSNGDKVNCITKMEF